jgi:putative flavoprotein involved in K+ transport
VDVVDVTTVVVIGAGPAGLAMSRCLRDESIDHVLLERAEVAFSWRHERWDSLRTLTPNWMNRLPRLPYRGDDPDGYMTATEVADSLVRYAQDIDAPVKTGTRVVGIGSASQGWRVKTDHGPWRCRAVVIATGASSQPRVPAVAAQLPATIQQLSPTDYRNPEHLGPGRVLVVGASASGIQIADELARSGRDVTLAVGEHVRLPRTYRGHDIHWWMEAIGLADERWNEIDDLARARRVPSPQLAGTPDRRSCDLNTLRAAGVTVVGRVVGLSGGRLQCSGSLANLAANADLKQNRLLDRIDTYAAEAGLDDTAPERPAPTTLGTPATQVHLTDVDTIVWATGYRPTYPWLDHAMLDRRGQITHDGGVMPAPGLYVVGLPLLRRRKSSFLDGIGADTVDLTVHLREHLQRFSMVDDRRSVRTFGASRQSSMGLSGGRFRRVG